MAFILASASPRRRELIEIFHLDQVKIIPSPSEETFTGLDPEETVKRTALSKARAVQPLCESDDTVLAADTLVFLDGRQLGKPHSREEAYTMSDSIAVMDEGRLLTCKPTKSVFADPGSVPAAVLTGCKNIAPARKCGERQVEVPSWGVRLTTGQPVGDGLAAIGIRAHYFNPASPQNRFPVVYQEELEEPFELTIQFRYAGQDPKSEPIWWRVPKDRRPAQFPAELGVSPANILLLYE